MKKTTAFISTLMFGSLLAGIALPAAAEVTTAKKDSYGIIEFKKDKNPNPEKPDPEEPGKPGEKPGPNEPEGPGTENDGALKVLFASNFDFRQQKITADSQTIFASLTPWSIDDKPSKPTPNFVQVEDLRPGKESTGWALSVKQSKGFTTYKDGAKPTDENAEQLDELTGLKMSLHGVEVFGKQAEGKLAKVTGEDITISKESAEVMTAETGSGIGRSSAVFAKDKKDVPNGEFENPEAEATKGDAGVKLEIPQGTNAYEAKYYATIEWALTNGPE